MRFEAHVDYRLEAKCWRIVGSATGSTCWVCWRDGLGSKLEFDAEVEVALFLTITAYATGIMDFTNINVRLIADMFNILFITSS